MADLDQLQAILRRDAMQQLQHARVLGGRGPVPEGYNPHQLLLVNNQRGGLGAGRPAVDIVNRYQVLLNNPHLRRAHPAAPVRMAPFLHLIKMEEDVLR